MDLFDRFEEISITEIEGIKIGNAQNTIGGTGCTVIISEKGAVTGIDVRGGGPATRETDRLSPLCPLDKNHAIVLSGGSAFGLDASAGVMKFLEEQGIGYKTRVGIVPLVAGASIFDFGVGDSKTRPDKDMGYDACLNAYKNEFREGNCGVGTGATVGKFLGPGRMMKSGLGSYSVRFGELIIGAVVVVNALGDVYDIETGNILAGLQNEDGTAIQGTISVLPDRLYDANDFYNENTTLGCVITNAQISNSEATKISAISQNGLAKVIWPVHTSADGDAIFTMGTGTIKADANLIGPVASEVMAKAVNNAVRKTGPAYNLHCAGDFQ